MTCEQVQIQLADFWQDALDQQDAAQVAAHLRSCSECSALSQLWTDLGRVEQPEAVPTAALRTQVDLMIEAFREGQRAAATQGAAHGRAPAPERRWWPALTCGLAAATLVIGLLSGLLLGTGRGSSTVEMQALRQEIQNTRQLVTVSMLQQESASDRLQGIDFSYRLPRPDEQVVDALLDAVRRDPSVNVRLAALDALQRLRQRPEVRKGLMDAFRQQQSPMVQIALVDAIAQPSDAGTVTFLKGLRGDTSLDDVVRERIDVALAR